MTVSCTPAVKVTVPKVSGAKGKPAAAKPQREVVQVYWDVSKSMRELAVKPVVAALDSTVLLSAHVSAVEQYGVGEAIVRLPSAQAALKLTANRTALHLAAEKIGMALAKGDAQAALVISDMELDTPPHASAKDATVCGGVPLPSTREAGALFGRCFESAISTSDTPITRKSLLVHVFRKSTPDRELFILLFATDREFGRRISNEVVKRIDVSRHVIFDSGAVAAANVKACRMTLMNPDAYPLAGPACGAKCLEPNATIQVECELQRSASDAWIHPIGHGVDGVKYESAKKKGDRAWARFSIPCSTPPGRVDATVSFSWKSQNDGAEFAKKPSVRDLFDSLTDAIVRTVALRRLNIGIVLK